MSIYAMYTHKFKLSKFCNFLYKRSLISLPVRNLSIFPANSHNQGPSLRCYSTDDVNFNIPLVPDPKLELEKQNEKDERELKQFLDNLTESIRKHEVENLLPAIKFLNNQLFTGQSDKYKYLLNKFRDPIYLLLLPEYKKMDYDSLCHVRFFFVKTFLDHQKLTNLYREIIRNDELTKDHFLIFRIIEEIAHLNVIMEDEDLRYILDMTKQHYKSIHMKMLCDFIHSLLRLNNKISFEFLDIVLIHFDDCIKQRKISTAHLMPILRYYQYPRDYQFLDHIIPLLDHKEFFMTGFAVIVLNCFVNQKNYDPISYHLFVDEVFRNVSLVPKNFLPAILDIFKSINSPKQYAPAIKQVIKEKLHFIDQFRFDFEMLEKHLTNLLADEKRSHLLKAEIINSVLAKIQYDLLTRSDQYNNHKLAIDSLISVDPSSKDEMGTEINYENCISMIKERLITNIGSYNVQNFGEKDLLYFFHKVCFKYPHLFSRYKNLMWETITQVPLKFSGEFYSTSAYLLLKCKTYNSQKSLWMMKQIQNQPDKFSLQDRITILYCDTQLFKHENAVIVSDMYTELVRGIIDRHIEITADQLINLLTIQERVYIADTSLIPFALNYIQLNISSIPYSLMAAIMKTCCTRRKRNKTVMDIILNYIVDHKDDVPINFLCRVLYHSAFLELKNDNFYNLTVPNIIAHIDEIPSVGLLSLLVAYDKLNIVPQDLVPLIIKKINKNHLEYGDKKIFIKYVKKAFDINSTDFKEDADKLKVDYEIDKLKHYIRTKSPPYHKNKDDFEFLEDKYSEDIFTHPDVLSRPPKTNESGEQIRERISHQHRL